MSNKTGSSPAVKVAKDQVADGAVDKNVIELEVGGRAKLMPVSATLIGEVTSYIKDPDVPMWLDENKDREVPNPNDPAYIKALDEAERERGIAALDALIMFGVELLDGVPAEETWLPKLKFFAKKGQLDLSDYDMEDDLDVEFLYKRFIAVPVSVATQIGKLSGISSEEVEQAEASFPGDETR